MAFAFRLLTVSCGVSDPFLLLQSRTPNLDSYVSIPAVADTKVQCSSELLHVLISNMQLIHQHVEEIGGYRRIVDINVPDTLWKKKTKKNRRQIRHCKDYCLFFVFDEFHLSISEGDTHIVVDVDGSGWHNNWHMLDDGTWTRVEHYCVRVQINGEGRGQLSEIRGVGLVVASDLSCFRAL
ncbi:uncharacterized protein STEHIDRAFT_112876 [Stereum hirsutum FP-91666 SS1]|uniref:uncharacterized protein n=1 Tax=Stereum hirsutum (strain FP-91666) TaxID=721885 RepID=UPI000444981F|nr:uncharacterized protein STEHIDRAFT_112876 [Stereum hirsutum FP-91666 SS1]EIM84520.1 hypothetical protein STEHIDRAFT_112876 [Stereum hirsutum FP-91666 SS1]